MTALSCTCDYAGQPGEPHKQWCEQEYGPHAECATRITELEAERGRWSNRLRAMARRHGVLRRAYNSSSVDPWETPEYCANANAASPCGPALRWSGLCVDCQSRLNRQLNARITAALALADAAKPGMTLNDSHGCRPVTWDLDPAALRRALTEETPDAVQR